jgi:hypothetical protein
MRSRPVTVRRVEALSTYEEALGKVSLRAEEIDLIIQEKVRRYRMTSKL